MHRKTYRWWKFLSLAAIANVMIWLWVFAVHSEPTYFTRLQLMLSGIYVLVCAFRAFYPRIDLERYCLFDSPLSSIVLGRSLATIAELAFTAQCALLLYALGHYIESPMIVVAAYSIVPIIVAAQLSCWYATLSLNHFWHGVEEAIWILMLVIVTACFIKGVFELDGFLQLVMMIGLLASLAAIYIMLFVDIPMYLKRTRKGRKKGRRYLGLIRGMQDAWNRREPTGAWKVWKHEVVWLSTYFTVGVWLSIGMVFVTFG